MPGKNLKKPLTRSLGWLFGLGIPLLAARAYVDRNADLVSQDIEKNGVVLQQYWLIKASGETETAFVAENSKAHDGLAAARKYDEIVGYGDLMAGIVQNGVARTSPLTLNALYRKSTQLTNAKNADFVFPASQPDRFPASMAAQIHRVELRIFDHALGSFNYIRLVDGNAAVVNILMDETLKRHICNLERTTRISIY